MDYGRNNTSRRYSSFLPKEPKKRKNDNTKLFTLKIVLLAILVIMIIGLLAGGILFKKIIDDTPKVSANDLKPSAFTTTAYANDGTTALGTFVDAGSNRVFKSLEEIPKDLQKAFIAVEDSRFYEHKGVDWAGVARAGIKGITSGSFSQGGSTITQQLIKNSIFPNFNTETRIQRVKRKIQELYLAVQVEKTVSKDVILEDYLNTINLGQNTLGVQAAAKRYFGKDVMDLTLSECATIAAITKSPSGYNPITNPEANAKRREKVLDDMLAEGYITKKQHKEALADDVYSRIQAADTAYKESLTVNSYFLDEVVKAVTKDLCNELGYSAEQAHHAVYSGGLKIITTQDLTMQQICDEEINNAANYPSKVEWTVTGAISVIYEDGTQKHYDHNNFGNYVKDAYGVEYGTTFATPEKATAMLEEYIATLKGSDNDQVITNITLAPQPQATVVVMDQYTGHVKAMVGGRGEKTSNMSLNRATQSPRQPGSTFKVLSTFVPALDAKGNTLATLIEDSPFRYANGGAYVKNWWGSSYKGHLTIRYCIQQSANVCTVKKYTEITPELGLKYLLENFAFTTLDAVNDSGQATSLGGITNGVYNIELTAAYASIANKGIYTEPILYTQIYDHDGNLLFEKQPKTHVAMKETTAALITNAMRDVVTKGTGTKAKLSGVINVGKTGSTTDDRDFWFSGYTPYLTASVWAGYDDNKSMSGSTSFHNVIWRKIMQRIHDAYGYNAQSFEMPSGIVKKSICKETGKLAGATCEKYTEYFAADTLPKQTCTGHATATPAPAPAPAPTPTPAPSTPPADNSQSGNAPAANSISESTP